MELNKGILQQIRESNIKEYTLMDSITEKALNELISDLNVSHHSTRGELIFTKPIDPTLRKSTHMIFLPYNTPSLKNSKVKTRKGVFASKTVSKYLQKIGIKKYSTSKKTVDEYVDPNRENLFRKAFEEAKWIKPEQPIVLGFHFVRGSKHKFDFGNACQIIQDLMVAHDYIEDDNMDYLIPVPFQMNGQWYSYDKTNPGVYITIVNDLTLEYWFDPKDIEFEEQFLKDKYNGRK